MGLKKVERGEGVLPSQEWAPVGECRQVLDGSPTREADIVVMLCWRMLQVVGRLGELVRHELMQQQ